MIGFNSNNENAAFNLATEEYLLKNHTEDIFFLYSDTPSIIVGKHQNSYAEINFKEVFKKNIAVYRRLSGGGTVYHDLGNLNFCFITNGQPNNLIDFKGFTSKITDALQKIGIKASLGGRNEILIEGKKISGNASHIYRNRVMHHGTLLFNTNLSLLGNSLKTDPSKYQDKAVKSVRSVVTNISDHLNTPITDDVFRQYIFNEIIPLSNNQHSLSINEIDEINSLVESKYSTWEWNYGYSPNYNFKKRINLSNTTVLLEFSVQKGIITNTNYKMSTPDLQIENCLRKLDSTSHRIESIEMIFAPLSNSLNQSERAEFILQFF